MLDNMSIDGCCRHLPREVLIVRTDGLEPPNRLWLLGCSLAQGESVLWLPGLLSCSPDRFRALVLAAADLAAQEATRSPGHRPRRITFCAARAGAALLTPLARASLGRSTRILGAGSMLTTMVASRLRLVIPLEPALNNACPLPAGPDPMPASVAAIKVYSSRTLGPDKPSGKPLSVIITAHNEGPEVLRTVESVRSSTRLDHEIIVVDDGSTDGSCSELEGLGVRLIRNPERVGVACSRDAGTRAAVGETYAYLDAHQRVESGCLDRCAELAVIYGAITRPPCRPLNRRYPVGYGASFRLDAERGFFSARYRVARPRGEITRTSALRSPAYVIPRSLYQRVAWISGLRGWGATESSVAVKAFFTDVDILLVSTGATQHLFRKRFPYQTSWEGIWRNHALIARVCFDDRTWARYWLPEVFQGNLSDDVLHELDSPAVLDEREAFMAVKVRPDREFWRGLLRIPEPKSLV